MREDGAWQDIAVSHVTHGLPAQFQRRPYPQKLASTINVGALHAAAKGVRPPPEFSPTPLKKADDAEKQAAYFRHWFLTRLQRAAHMSFWCLLVLVPFVLVVLYLPEILRFAFGLHKVPTKDGGHVLVRAGVLDTLEEHCKQGIKAILLEDEVTADAALDPLRRCREYAGQAVVKDHHAVGRSLSAGVLPSGVVVTARPSHVADTVSSAVLAARKGQDVINAGPPAPVVPPPAMPPAPACSTVTAESQLLYLAGRSCIFAPIPPAPPPGPETKTQWGQKGRMRKWAPPERKEAPSGADTASMFFLHEFVTRHPARKPMGIAAQAAKMLFGGQTSAPKETKTSRSKDGSGALEARDAVPDRPTYVATGLQRRIISVGRSLSTFAIEAAAAMNDGAVESVLYLPTNEDRDAVTHRMEQPDVAALRLTVIPVAKRIEATAQVQGGQVTDAPDDVRWPSFPWRTPSTRNNAFHDAGDEWALMQPSPPLPNPPPPTSPPPNPRAPPPTPRAGYMGVMSSTLDYDACAMVITPDSGTGGDGPEVDFCKDYGQVVLIRIGGDADVSGVLNGMEAVIRLGLTRAVLFETTGTDRTLSGAARHFRGTPYNVYWVGRYDALRTADTAGSRSQNQPSLVRIDGEYYRPLLEEFLPSSTVKTVLAVRRDDEFVVSALRYGLTVCDSSCGCKVPEDKPCGESSTYDGARGDEKYTFDASNKGGKMSWDAAMPGRDANEARAIQADVAAAAAVAAAVEKGAAAALSAADRSSGALDPSPVVKLRANEELGDGTRPRDNSERRGEEVRQPKKVQGKKGRKKRG